MWSLESIAQTCRLSRSRCPEHVSARHCQHTILPTLQKRFRSCNELRHGSRHVAPFKIEIPGVGRKSSDERGEQTKVPRRCRIPIPGRPSCIKLEGEPQQNGHPADLPSLLYQFQNRAGHETVAPPGGNREPRMRTQ